MNITASEVAKYIIAEFHESEDLITNMKVQKLLYYVQGWHLGLYGTPVFPDEFQAWVHGPVQNEVYQEYKEYSWNPITKPIEKPKFEQSLINHIEQVLECYGGETGFSLELMTHKEWPWIEARDDLAFNEPSQNILSIKTMTEYFTELVQENEKNHNYTLNKESIKAFEESKRGIGITTFTSVEEMFNEIYQELEEEGFKVVRHV
jgi:uncharacterized phage-associated protein